MDKRLSDAVFELGRLSCDKSLSNHELLRRMARTAAEFTGMEVTGLGVFEAVESRGEMVCHVVGPWREGEPKGETTEDERERILALRLVNLEPNRVYRGSELPESATDCDDEAAMRFCRADGAELVLGLRAVEHGDEVPSLAIGRAEELGPYLAACWTSGWKREPTWVAELKPSGHRVLQLVLEGLDDDQIADETGLTYHSVRAHLKRLFRDAGVRSRLHLMQAYRSNSRPEKALATAV